MTAVLYDYWRSTASYRVRIALGLAGVDYKSVSVNLLEREQEEASHLARKPARPRACAGNRRPDDFAVARDNRVPR